MFEEAFCVLRMRNEPFSFFDRLYLVTDVSYGDRKCAIFLSFSSSFMWCGQFCPGRTFYLFFLFSSFMWCGQFCPGRTIFTL